MIKRLFVSAILALVTCSASAAPLTQEQRAEVVQTIRQALHDDPSIVRNALRALQTAYAQQQDAAAADAIAAL